MATSSPKPSEAPRPTLCLSGGGYRAAAYHLGVTRRLHELGILPRVERLSCVSGGSILGAFLLQRYPAFRGEPLAGFDWKSKIEEPFADVLCKCDLRTWPVLRRWGVTVLWAVLACAWYVESLAMAIRGAPLTWEWLPAWLYSTVVYALPMIFAVAFFGWKVLLIALAVPLIWACHAGVGVLGLGSLIAGSSWAGAVVVSFVLLMLLGLGLRWAALGFGLLGGLLAIEIFVTQMWLPDLSELTWGTFNAVLAVGMAYRAFTCPSSSVESLRHLYVEHLLKEPKGGNHNGTANRNKDVSLDEVVPPESPVQFCFNSTDLVFGARWVAERHFCDKTKEYHHRVGSYQAGYGLYEGKRGLPKAARWTLARAVAASSCFPPVFGPMQVRWPASRYRGTRYIGAGSTQRQRAADRREKLEAMMVNDGGNFGNLGLSAAEDSPCVIVSDGGAPLHFSPPQSPIELLRRYLTLPPAVNVNQEIRRLLRAFGASLKAGAVVRIGRRLGDRCRTPELILRSRVARRLANVRTDLAPLTRTEFTALEELGYVSIDERINKYAPALVPIASPPQLQATEWIDAADAAVNTKRADDLIRRLLISHRRMIAPGLRRGLERVLARATELIERLLCGHRSMIAPGLRRRLEPVLTRLRSRFPTSATWAK